GQFGLRLVSEPSYGVATRTEFLKVDHYVQVGNDPDGNPIFVPVFAPFFDDASNNTQAGTPQLGGLTPPMGDDNNLIHALGGNDAIASGAGNDQLFGEGTWRERGDWTNLLIHTIRFGRVARRMERMAAW